MLDVTIFLEKKYFQYNRKRGKKKRFLEKIFISPKNAKI